MKYRITLLIILLFFFSNSLFSQVYFSDDFESGLDKWVVSGQDWDTTSVSFSSSNHSVTDSPIGNYLANTDARITINNTLNLALSIKPILTFWHKFYTQGNVDICRIEISTDNGFNWSEFKSYSGGNRTWSYIQLDLSKYKMSSVLIRFRLTSDGGNQYEGWSIDDVEIKELDTELIPFPFIDTFENGLHNWLVSAQGWDTTSTDFASQNHSITDSPDGNYTYYENTHIRLIHPIDLTNTTNPILTFWQKFYTQGNADLCYVEISTDSGFTWSELGRFSGGNRTWSHIQLDLLEYKMPSVLLRFRLTSDGGNQYEGWSIDDVEIKELDTELIPFPFIDTFENGLNNWLLSDQDWKETSNTYVSPINSITESPGSIYTYYANTHLLLAHPIDISNATFPILTFWQKYNTQVNADFCRVEISDDGGFSWQEIIKFSGAKTTWHKEQFDLSLYKSPEVLIRFRLTSDGGNQYEGWSIDDVEIFDLSGNRAPTIESFSANPTFGKAPLNISFEAQASDIDGSIAEYIWDFDGDGVNEDTTLTGSNNYIYNESGTFNATCRVTDDQGTSGSPAIVQIDVYSDSMRIVSVPDDSASIDGTFVLPIQINDVSGIAGAEFRLNYNPAILEAENASSTNLTTGFSLTDSVSNGSVVISMARATGLASGSGDFVNITFHVSSDAIAGQTSVLTLDQVSLYDADTNPIDLSTVNGLFTVKTGTGVSETLKRIFIQPGLDTLELNQTALYTAFAVDTDDNVAEIDVVWNYEPVYGSPGGISPNSGQSTVFTATGVGDGLIAATYTSPTETFTDTAYVIVGDIKGDINIDEEINVPDAILCLQIAAEILSPSPYQNWSADFDYSRVVNSADAIGILTESLNNLLPKIGSTSTLITNQGDPAVIYPLKYFNKSSNLLSVSIFVANRPDVCGMDLEIDYNRTDLTLVDVSSGKSSTLLVKNLEQSKLSTINLEGLPSEDGEIVCLHFKKNNNVSDSDIRLTSVDIFDQKGNAIDTQLELTRPEQTIIPSRYVLHQNFPNPFNPSTTIKYSLPEAGEVFVAIYNITGQIIQPLINENKEAGTYSLTWNGTDNQGQIVSSGVYFYKIVFNKGEWFDVKKMLLVK